MPEKTEKTDKTEEKENEQLSHGFVLVGGGQNERNNQYQIVHEKEKLDN